MSDSGIRITGRLVFGLVVIALGVVFLLEELGIADAGRILRYWPAVLLAYGVMRITGFFCRQNVIGGALFALAGAWLLLKAVDVIPYDPWDFWPVILVAIGVSMVLGALGRARPGGPAAPRGAGSGNGAAAGGEDPSPTISAFAVWSGVDRKVVAQNFRGGDVTAIMGGHEIDLRGAKLEGESAVIDLFVVMGGVDLRVPEDWSVECDGVAIMGALEDNTRSRTEPMRGRLILRGLILMGGVEVKN